MADTNDDGKEKLAAAPPVDIVSETLIGGTESFFAAQAQMLADVRSVALTWLRRRQDAINEAQASLDEMRACRTVADLMRVQQEWINRSMQRFAADMVAWGDTANELSRKALVQIDAGSRGITGGEKPLGLIAGAQSRSIRPPKT
jgi:hypothetical protein